MCLEGSRSRESAPLPGRYSDGRVDEDDECDIDADEDPAPDFEHDGVDNDGDGLIDEDDETDLAEDDDRP